ncbi:hypothetical protein HWI79_2299 [Cryptosporidium felis]|nr:hypothetical protein HWI79_2299 [Cryptosporidium felis]
MVSEEDLKILSEKNKSIEYLRKIDDFHHKIDTGIIKLKSKLVSYIEKPLYDYLNDTRKEVDELYNETRLFVYTCETPFNPRYTTDEEVMSRYTMAKLIEIKSRVLMEKTIDMLNLESDHFNRVVSKAKSYCYD